MTIKTNTWLLHICKNKKLLHVFPLYLCIKISISLQLGSLSRNHCRYHSDIMIMNNEMVTLAPAPKIFSYEFSHGILHVQKTIVGFRDSSKLMK